MELTQLVPQLGGGLFTIAAFVVSLSIIVAIHEYGHYIVGRWSGIHAEVFSLGFGPVLYARTDRRGTVWQVAALPFGGFVKFLGDANAASVGGTDTVAGFTQRQTMLGAPLWARVVTVAAGPVFNFILAIVLFAAFLMVSGQPRDPVTYAAGVALPPAYASDLQPGDELLMIGDIAMGGEDSLDTLPVTDRVDYTVRRDGAEIVVQGPYPLPPRASGIAPRSAADDAGLRIGDVITTIDGQPIFAFRQIIDVVNASDGQPLDMTVWRDGTVRDVTLAPRRVDLPQADGTFDTRWLLGLNGDLFFQTATDRVAPWTALWQGTQQLWFTITLSLSALSHMIAGDISTCSLSGPVGIAETSATMAGQGLASYMSFIAILSAGVGLMNLFPIPILDGGHLLFYAYEGVTRRKPSDRAMNAMMFAGLTVILSLMVFSLVNDMFLCP
ncbi:regulator of sigma E protease [Loktanella fryxellensis]|uniref:Zinc metalloprotease n=1 Tax=Loktanella fryxellensis TaxID=245187 RepID=A0A1H8IDV7_9RHOB|nr:RIP metalloprotease RseP [Loktanella fryxellensis]SEN66297.1 regulator of sigma E protease [Loktanella fryxellensis]